MKKKWEKAKNIRFNRIFVQLLKTECNLFRT